MLARGTGNAPSWWGGIGRSRGRRTARRFFAGLLAPSLAIAIVLVVAPAPAFAADGPVTYSTPGTYSYTVPAGVTAVAFAVFGSQGEQAPNAYTPASDGTGGSGGGVTGSFSVPAGTVLSVDVGGYGTGFYPGGAVPGHSGGYGGGASDIRGWAIAGGGGGGGSSYHYPAYEGPDYDGGDGGAGGYPPGSPGNDGIGDASFYGEGGGPGTQYAGGAAGDNGNGWEWEPDYTPSTAGSIGSGGVGGRATVVRGGGGGGGGGYYGGGGGGSSGEGGIGIGGAGGGGGGGSSWVSTQVMQPEFCSGCLPGTGRVTITPLVTDPQSALVESEKSVLGPVSSQPAEQGSLAPVNLPVMVSGRVVGSTTTTRVRVSVLPIASDEGAQLLLFDAPAAADGTFSFPLTALPSNAQYAAQVNDNVLNLQIDAVQVNPVTHDTAAFGSAYTAVRLIAKDSHGTGMNNGELLIHLTPLIDKSGTVTVPAGDAPSAAYAAAAAGDTIDAGVPLGTSVSVDATPRVQVPVSEGVSTTGLLGDSTTVTNNPVPPGCGLVSGPVVTILRKAQRMTVVSEVHAYWDATASYGYTHTADTDISVAMSYDAGKTFSIEGSSHDGRSIGEGFNTGQRGPMFGRQVRGAFKYSYDRLRYTCQATDEEFDHYRIAQRGFGAWDNSTPLVDFGADVSSKDGGGHWAYAPAANKRQVLQGTEYHRNKGKSQRYNAAVSAFGITLGGQTGNSDDQTLSITAGYKPQSHEIWGSNTQPYKAENVYSY